MSKIQEIIDKLSAGTESIIPKEDFFKKIDSGKKLIIKLGMDPTSPDLHLGHAVVLSKMKQFQDFGFNIIFLIGDFTARIGDPTGRSKTRPPLTEEQILENTKTYFNQVSKILDKNQITIRYNSQWLDKLSSKEFVNLCGKVTLARIIEREDFSNRIKEHISIGFHELLYPLMQGYDSVELKADVELGGTDQTFNLLMGRFLQEHYGQEPQVIMTLPILPGLDGTEKMSKSLGNSIGLTEPASQAFGKLMSISDSLMWTYYEILLHKTKKEIEAMKQEVDMNLAHPMNLKKEMATSIIDRFWSKEEANLARNHFESLFQKKDYSNATEFQLDSLLGKDIILVDLIKKLGAADSATKSRRLISDGAVYIDNQKITDIKATVLVKSGMIIKVGKHKIYKIA